MREKFILESSHISICSKLMYYSVWETGERSRFMKELDELSLGLLEFGVCGTSGR